VEVKSAQKVKSEKTKKMPKTEEEKIRKSKRQEFQTGNVMGIWTLNLLTITLELIRGDSDDVIKNFKSTLQKYLAAGTNVSFYIDIGAKRAETVKVFALPDEIPRIKHTGQGLWTFSQKPVWEQW
jgi:hypothetical protein